MKLVERSTELPAKHLAALAAESQKVMVMDLDPQGSALEWASRRGDRPPDITAAHPASLAKEIERGREDGYILTVIDTAPHADHVALQAARAADLVVIPCRPATFDIAVTAPEGWEVVSNSPVAATEPAIPATAHPARAWPLASAPA